MLRRMRKLIIWVVILVGLVVSVPAYYTYLGPPLPTPPGAGESVALADGTKLNVIQLGPGPNIVLVHGTPGSAYDWGALPQQLVAAGRHVVVYDRKGYGFSDRRAPGEAYTLDANAKELNELLAALDLRDATVVGWSYGGGVALRAAALDAERIGRLVLIGSVGPTSQSAPPAFVARVAMSAPVREWIARVPPISNRLMVGFAKQAFSNERPPSTWLPQMQATLNLPGVRDTQRAETQALDVSVLRPEEIQRPVLLIHGTDDRIVPLAVAEDLSKRIQGSELVRIDDGSHMLPITDTAKLSRRIAAFAAGR
jgi:non-heme chloroperoxidase